MRTANEAMIYTTFIKPFLLTAKKIALSKRLLKQFINVIFLSEKRVLKTYIDKEFMNNPSALEDIQAFYVSHANLITLYRGKNAMFSPSITNSELKTIIRELFHDYLNPLPNLIIHPAGLSYLSEPMARPFPLLPDEMHAGISAYLDKPTKRAWSETCKFTYFQPRPAVYFYPDYHGPFYYRVAGNVAVTQGLKIKKSISSEEMMKSYWDCQENEISLFPSLYHAVEYAHSKKDEINPRTCGNTGPGFIPSIFVVAYAGDHAKLQLQSKEIDINYDPFAFGLAYSEEPRSATIKFAMVDRLLVTPLLGTVILEKEDFATYHHYEIVDCDKALQVNDNRPSLRSSGLT